MDDTLGQRIKRLRRDKGLSQTQLAEWLGVTKSAISLYETDAREPPNSTLIRMAVIFRVSIEYLLGVSEEKAIIVSDLSEEEQRIIQDLVDYMRGSNNE